MIPKVKPGSHTSLYNKKLHTPSLVMPTCAAQGTNIELRAFCMQSVSKMTLQHNQYSKQSLATLAILALSRCQLHSCVPVLLLLLTGRAPQSGDASTPHLTCQHLCPGKGHLKPCLLAYHMRLLHHADSPQTTC